jgi:hypothetical protein
MVTIFIWLWSFLRLSTPVFMLPFPLTIIFVIVIITTITKGPKSQMKPDALQVFAV